MLHLHFMLDFPVLHLHFMLDFPVFHLHFMLACFAVPVFMLALPVVPPFI